MSRCAVCTVEFERKYMSQRTCFDATCKKEWKRQLSIKRAERLAIRKRREAVKSRSDWLKEAQAAFNAWIRLRDAELPCISCGRYHQGSYDAGHYRSVGAAPALRFHPDNVHKQCVPCNQHKSGNVVEYRINLVRKIGVSRVEWLEGPHEPAKYSIEDIRKLKSGYQGMVKAMRKAAQ